MSFRTFPIERRREPRAETDHTIRWKRPGRIEDQKGWMLDESSSGLGFLVAARSAPRVGDRLHIRHRDGRDWVSIERHVSVARVTLMPGDDLAVIGCRLD